MVLSLVYLILIIILFKKLLSIVICIYKNILLKYTIKYDLEYSFKKISYILIIIFINDLIIYLYASKLLYTLTFIIK